MLASLQTTLSVFCPAFASSLVHPELSLIPAQSALPWYPMPHVSNPAVCKVQWGASPINSSGRGQVGDSLSLTVLLGYHLSHCDSVLLFVCVCECV